MQYQEISANFERRGDWWVAEAIELPGVYASGSTLMEARDNLLNAVRQALAEDGAVEIAEPLAFLN